MKKIYALKLENGAVSIMEIYEDNSIEIELKKWQETNRIKLISYREITLDQLPADREFRNAWTDDFETETVDIHNEKAKELKLKELRVARDLELKNNDQEFLIAERSGNKKKKEELAEKRQKLLDITDGLKGFEIKKLNCSKTLFKIKELGTFIK